MSYWASQGNLKNLIAAIIFSVLRHLSARILAGGKSRPGSIGPLPCISSPPRRRCMVVDDVSHALFTVVSHMHLPKASATPSYDSLLLSTSRIHLTFALLLLSGVAFVEAFTLQMGVCLNLKLWHPVYHPCCLFLTKFYIIYLHRFPFIKQWIHPEITTGLLKVGTPQPWPLSKKNLNYVREAGVRQFISTYNRVKDLKGDELMWGDEVEYGIFILEDDDGVKRVKLSLRAKEVSCYVLW